MQIHILARAMFYRPDFMREMVLKGRHTELQKCDTTEQLDMPVHTIHHHIKKRSRKIQGLINNQCCSVQLSH